MQEAWLKGYWNEMVDFLLGLFNAIFKDNPSLERGLMTGITRISKESLFSDLNNVTVVTTTSKQYSDCFGFTEKEVFDAIDQFKLNNKDDIKYWYDGFIFGETKGVYNPWSIICYLNNRELNSYWVDTSSNALVGELINASSPAVKENMESLLRGESIAVALDEQIVFSQLEEREGALWSLLVAAGYLKVLPEKDGDARLLALTNAEVRFMMEKLITAWFSGSGVAGFSRDFRRALVRGETAALNRAMQGIAEETFSFFDVKGREPERFYHGFTLGLLVDMKESHLLKSNRESGLGRYDVMLIPRHRGDPGIVIEFKSLNAGEGGTSLEDAAEAALGQIVAKNYAADLRAQSAAPASIFAYGIVFQGKEVLVRGGRLADAALALQPG